MILDTTFLLDVLRGDDAVREWERRIDERGIGVVTAISTMERWEGIHLVDASAGERDRLRELLDGLFEAPFDRDAALRAGELSADLTDRGEQIDVEDVMIGAIALERAER